MSSLEDVRALYAEAFDIELDAVTPDTDIRSADEMDSLEFAEFIMECEERFEVTIPDFIVTGLRTIADLALFVDKSRIPVA